MNARAIVETALRSNLVDEDGEVVEIELLPPPGASEVAELRTRIPCAIPPSIQDLLAFCGGFHGSAADVVDFTGASFLFEQREIFPHGLPIASDGYGNHWVADLDSASVDWAPVFFACHDAPVVLFQSSSLSEFLTDLFDLSRPPHRSVVDDVHEDRIFQVWRTNPGVLSQEECLSSPDRELADFADSLDPTWKIIDLRPSEVGFGFSWGRYGPKTEIKRHGGKLIFAYRKPPGAVSRLLRGRS